MKKLQKIKVAALDDLIPLVGKKVVTDDKEIGLFLLSDGTIRAVNNICPHEGGPLSEGTVSGEFVYCPLHNTKIDLTDGCAPEDDYACNESYEVEVLDGDVYIWL